MPSVRFAPDVDVKSAGKRNREESDEAEPYQKRKRRDDVQDDDDVGDPDLDRDDELTEIPSEHALLEAKRKRRQNRDDHSRFSADKTHIDEKTSLASEGVTIEPFHMKNEETDGTGFFDGDTYVFRKNNMMDDDEEPDAWLDRLSENANQPSKSQLAAPRPKKESSSGSELDNLSKEELYSKIVPLIEKNETISQALVRYGRLLKPHTKSSVAKPAPVVANEKAKLNLDSLTGVANALLLQGEVGIYQMTGASIQNRLPKPSLKLNTTKLKNPKWEYRGTQDGQIHGPYTSEQMLGWTRAGYFVGSQRVMIRPITEKPSDVSDKDDLLADLLDDDEEDDTKPAAETEGKETGDWMWSTEVDFQSYIQGSSTS